MSGPRLGITPLPPDGMYLRRYFVVNAATGRPCQDWRLYRREFCALAGRLPSYWQRRAL